MAKRIPRTRVLALSLLLVGLAGIPSVASDQDGLVPLVVDSASASGSAPALGPHLNRSALALRSEMAVVVDAESGDVLYAKNTDRQRPIASLTKLMMAMVVLDAGLPEGEVVEITRADRDRLRGSRSKLRFGTELTRRDLLKIAVAGSENRAAAALGRTFPGGTSALVGAMNEKAKLLGMSDTMFQDATGLDERNRSTAMDLSALVRAASRYPTIREDSTIGVDIVTDQRSGRPLRFVNTNRLVRSESWSIDLSKTGYISDSGHCLVMQADLGRRPVIIVLLNSWGKLSKYGDANRIRHWIDRADSRARRSAAMRGELRPGLVSGLHSFQ